MKGASVALWKSGSLSLLFRCSELLCLPHNCCHLGERNHYNFLVWCYYTIHEWFALVFRSSMESIIGITILTLIVQQFPVNLLFGQWWKEIYCGTQRQQQQSSQHVFSLWKESHAMGIGMQDCSFWGFIESLALLIITFFIKLVPSFFSHITNNILQTLKLLTSLSYWSKVWEPLDFCIIV